MLNEVRRLTKGDFSNVTKNFKVVLKSLNGKTIDTICNNLTKYEAEKFIKEQHHRHNFNNTYLEIERM